MTWNHHAIQSITAAFAVVVSVTAALFAWKQVDVAQTHNRLSVMPVLQITPYVEGPGGRNGLYLSNDGLGPALVKSFSVQSGGMVASGFGADRWWEVLANTAADPVCFGSGWPKGETTLRAGSEVPLVFVTKAKEGGICQAELIKLVGGNPVDMTVGYESIYGEAKTLRADSRVLSKTLDGLYRALTKR